MHVNGTRVHIGGGARAWGSEYEESGLSHDVSILRQCFRANTFQISDCSVKPYVSFEISGSLKRHPTSTGRCVVSPDGYSSVLVRIGIEDLYRDRIDRSLLLASLVRDAVGKLCRSIRVRWPSCDVDLLIESSESSLAQFLSQVSDLEATL